MKSYTDIRFVIIFTFHPNDWEWGFAKHFGPRQFQLFLGPVAFTGSAVKETEFASGTYGIAVEQAVIDPPTKDQRLSQLYEAKQYYSEMIREASEEIHRLEQE